MEKNVEISMLCQVYGKVLTEKQYELLNDYYNNDLSLSEIAENNNITRQAVRDIIKKSENKLYELEEQVSAMKKMLENQKAIKSIQNELAKIDKTAENKEIHKAVENIKNQLKTIEEI
jgi:hypothetical protein